MGMWDSIKKTTNKITKSIMPNPTEVGEIIAAEQKVSRGKFTSKRSIDIRASQWYCVRSVS